MNAPLFFQQQSNILNSIVKKLKENTIFDILVFCEFFDKLQK